MRKEEIQKRLQQIQKKIKRSALEIGRIDVDVADDLISLRKEVLEMEKKDPEDIIVLKTLYYIECYLLNFQKAKEYLEKVVYSLGDKEDKRNLYILNNMLKKMEGGELTVTQLYELCNYVEERLKHHQCDHTHKYTMQWLKDNIPKSKHGKVIKMLENRGGYCDCEVVLNILEN